MVRKRTLGLIAAATVGAGIAARRGTKDTDVETEEPSPAVRISEAPDLSQIRDSVRMTDRGVDTTDANQSTSALRGWLSKLSVRAGIYVEHEDHDSTLSVLEWRP